jgi:hypothetical protein
MSLINKPLFHRFDGQVDSFRQAGGHISFKIYQLDCDYSNRFLHATDLGVPGILKIDCGMLWRSWHTRRSKVTRKDSISTRTLVPQGGSTLHELVPAERWGLQNLVRSREQMAFTLLRRC